MRSMTEAPGTIVVVDANNVRGAVNFRLSKLQLTTLCENWAAANGLANRIIIAWDHGLREEARIYRNVCHTWAGPKQSADDLIARSLVPGLYAHADTSEQGGERVCVVTTDRELLHRCKRAAFESGASHGRLRFFGTRKFVSLLFHSVARDAQQQSIGDEAAGDDQRDEHAIAAGFVRSEQKLRKFALTQRKLRAHERRRRRRPDGYAAPSAERTWVRVAMAERLRRLIVEQPEEPTVLGKAPPPQVTALVAQLASAAGEEAFDASLLSAEALLSDVRLDGKQRAILLRYGEALSKGDDDDAALHEEPSGPLKPRALPTKRQRRRKQRAAADELMRTEGGGNARSLAAAAGSERRHALLALERRHQIEGLDRWLRDEL